MKKVFDKLLLLNFWLLYSHIVVAQDNNYDSLKKVLLIEKEDTNKINTLLELSIMSLRNADFKNGMQYGKQALSLSEKNNFKSGLGRSYLCVGTAFYEQDNYVESLKNLYSALGILETVSDEKDIAEARQAIGGIYLVQNNDSEALSNYSIALKENEMIGNKSEVAQNLTTIADIYSDEGKYAGAEENFTRALNIYKGLGDKAPVWAFPFVYFSIGILYKDEGVTALTSGNKILAEKKFSEALKNYQDALNLYPQKGSQTFFVQMDISMGESYFYLNQIPKAKYFVQKGLQLNVDIHGTKDDMRAAYEVLTKTDSANGNYKEAYQHYKMFILYRDSVINEENTKKSLQTSMQYEFDKRESFAKEAQNKKDAEQKRIKNKQYFIIGGLGILVLAVLSIVWVQFRNNKQKQKANNLITKQKQQVEVTLIELKSTQAQLIQSEKMASLGELTAGIAHEIQNPLNFVNNFSEVNEELLSEMKVEMDKGNIDDAKAIANDAIENQQKILHHGKRADAIVKNMLQHSRSSNNKKEPTDINALADEYFRLAYHGLRAKDKSFNATMKTDFDETIGKINIIPQDIGRVLLNLFNNAFYAVNEKAKQTNGYEPTVLVGTKKINNKVEIKVKDNGNGIPQNIVDKIFQPFFTTKPTGEGTGLGLSLSYDIIKGHGGEINVKTKEGEGSVFTIQIPTIT